MQRSAEAIVLDLHNDDEETGYPTTDLRKHIYTFDAVGLEKSVKAINFRLDRYVALGKGRCY